MSGSNLMVPKSENIVHQVAKELVDKHLEQIEEEGQAIFDFIDGNGMDVFRRLYPNPFSIEHEDVEGIQFLKLCKQHMEFGRDSEAAVQLLNFIVRFRNWFITVANPMFAKKMQHLSMKIKNVETMNKTLMEQLKNQEAMFTEAVDAISEHNTLVDKHDQLIMIYQQTLEINRKLLNGELDQIVKDRFLELHKEYLTDAAAKKSVDTIPDQPQPPVKQSMPIVDSVSTDMLDDDKPKAKPRYNFNPKKS